MPGLITHYICGEAVINALPKKQQKLLNNYRQLYNIGTQGPDVFFYYIPGLISKKTRELGTLMHKNHTGLFIRHQIQYVLSQKGEEQDAACSYLCGYLSHYALDCNAHPYIYYNTGFRKKGVKDLKYSVHHRNFETAIDVLMLKLLTGQKPADKKLWELIKVNKNEAASVVSMLSGSIKKAYNMDLSNRQVFNAIKYMIRLTRILQSKHGRRKNLLALAENLTLGEHHFSSLIHDQLIKDDYDYLNLAKKQWYHPSNKEEELTHSFPEMYNQSVTDAVDMIQALFSYMHQTMSLEELLEIIGNKSLASGINCDDDVEFKYYKIYKEG